MTRSSDGIELTLFSKPQLLITELAEDFATLNAALIEERFREATRERPGDQLNRSAVVKITLDERSTERMWDFGPALQHPRQIFFIFASNFEFSTASKST